MRNIFCFLTFASVGLFGMVFADTTIWHGQVNADGKPTSSVKLNIGKKYKIKVSGKANLGKWRTNKQPLENDACFEFFADPSYQADIPPTKIDTLKNSINVTICDGKYSPDHIYESQPFLAAQSGLHFWIYDTNYEDNNGALDVEVIQVDNT